MPIWDFLKWSKNIALCDDKGISLTYEQLEDEGEKIAKAAGGRCLAFVLAKNSIGSILGYTGFLNNGVVPAMLSAQLDKDQLNNLIDAYRPEIIWIPDEMVSDFENWNAIYGSYGYTLLSRKSMIKTSDMEIDGVDEYDHMKKTDIDTGLYSELALLLTTSGSTGSPKFVRQSYDNIRSNADSICKYLKLDETERPITTLPMNYTYGLSIINSHLMVGATILVTEKGLMQKEFWQFFRTMQATSFGGVPYTYEMLDKLRFYRRDLPSLRTMTQAGGKLQEDLHEKFALFAKETNRNFVVMYGQCEATARMGYLPPDMAVEKRGSMGIAIPGGLFSLFDESGQQIKEPGKSGELVYEGKNVTLGYAEKRSDLIKGDERGGRLETGDIAQFDEDGYYYIVGRKKRFLKIYGNRVNLDEIDRLIKTKFGIEVASAGVDDHLYIFLVNADLAEEVRDYTASQTHLNPVAFKSVIINEIPKNDAGKTLYKELEKYYLK